MYVYSKINQIVKIMLINFHESQIFRKLLQLWTFANGQKTLKIRKVSTCDTFYKKVCK